MNNLKLPFTLLSTSLFLFNFCHFLFHNPSNVKDESEISSVLISQESCVGVDCERPPRLVACLIMTISCITRTTKTTLEELNPQLIVFWLQQWLTKQTHSQLTTHLKRQNANHPHLGFAKQYLHAFYAILQQRLFTEKGVDGWAVLDNDDDDEGDDGDRAGTIKCILSFLHHPQRMEK